MTTATDTKITQQDEELAALGDLVAVIPCDADGLIRGVDSTDRLFVRGTLRQVDAQWDPYMALLTEINDNLIAIKNATGGTVTVEPWKYVGEAGEIAFDDDWENDPSLVPTVFGPLRYRKEGDVVRVEGCVSGGTPDPTSATGVTTLPAGYRPEYITVVGASSIDDDGDPVGTALLTVTPVGTLAVAAASESAVLYFAEFVVAA